MHNQVLDIVSSARYLGVDLSTNLNFNSHIQRISSNANKSLGYIKRNIRPKHPGIREAAYKTLVCPQLEYGSIVWSPYTQSNIHKVEMVQQRAIRWTLSNYSPYESVTDMQLSLDWRSLEQGRADAHLCMLYKTVPGIIAIHLPPYFQQPTRMTHHSHPLTLRQNHTSANFYKYSFFPLAVVQRNRLPTDIVLLSTLTQFSAAVRSLDHQMP